MGLSEYAQEERPRFSGSSEVQGHSFKVYVRSLEVFRVRVYAVEIRREPEVRSNEPRGGHGWCPLVLQCSWCAPVQAHGEPESGYVCARQRSRSVSGGARAGATGGNVVGRPRWIRMRSMTTGSSTT